MDWRPSHEFDIRKRGSWSDLADLNCRDGDPDPMNTIIDISICSKSVMARIGSTTITSPSTKSCGHSKIWSATVDPQDSITDNVDGDIHVNSCESHGRTTAVVALPSSRRFK